MKKQGFTLVELLAVIVLLALFAAVITPAVTKSINKAEQRVYEEEISEIKKAAENYFADQSTFLEEGDSLAISVSQLVLKKYLDDVPKDSLNGGYMDGVVVIKMAANVPIYQYYTKEESKNVPSVLVVEEDAVIDKDHPIVLDGITHRRGNNLLRLLAEQLEADTDAEITRIDGASSLVLSNETIEEGVDYFQDVFETMKSYTFQFDTKVMPSYVGVSAYAPQMVFVYSDGSTSSCNIGSSSDSEFTTYTCSSDSEKSLKSVQFFTESNTAYRFAWNLESFSISPERVGTPFSPVTFESTGENGVISLSFVYEDHHVEERTIAIDNPLLNLRDSDVEFIKLYPSGKVEMNRFYSKITLSSSNISAYNTSVVSNSESNGYHTFQIAGVIPEVSDWSFVSSSSFSYLPRTDLNYIGTYKSGETLFIKVLISEFPDVDSFLRYFKTHSVDFYYSDPKTKTFTTSTIDLNGLQYVILNDKMNGSLSLYNSDGPK